MLRKKQPLKKGQIRDRLGIVKFTRQPVWTNERLRMREIILRHLENHDLVLGDLTRLAHEHGFDRAKMVKVKELLAIEGILRRARKKE